MKYTLDWLTDPEVFAVNRIAAHSDHRIYANHLEADADNSSLIQNLNGTWKFAWAKNPSEWKQKFYEESDSTDNFDNIQVPGHMELWFCQYHLTHFIRTRIMQRERYDHSRAFFGLPEAAHHWRCRFFC